MLRLLKNLYKNMKLKKGDNIIMLSGKDRGKTGKIVRVSPDTNSVAVEGLNMIKKHVRAKRQDQKGQILERERFVSVSSVALVCKSCGKPTRVGFQLSGKGAKAEKVRICKKCKATI